MPKRLAEIIVETSLASRADVRRAAIWADEDNVPLIVTLVRRLQLDELAIVSAIKRHTRVSLPDPATLRTSPDAIRELPRELCWRLRVMPLSKSWDTDRTKVLHMAMADPTDAVAIAEIKHVGQCRAEKLLLSLSAVEELVETAYRGYVTDIAAHAATSGSYSTDFEGPTQPIPPPVHDDADTSLIDLEEAERRILQKKKPSTVPHHRVTDEASLAMRHRALLRLLVKKKILTLEEFHEEVRTLMKQRSDDA